MRILITEGVAVGSGLVEAHGHLCIQPIPRSLTEAVARVSISQERSRGDQNAKASVMILNL